MIKHAVVTGAFQGLGRRIADALEAHGEYIVHRWDVRSISVGLHYYVDLENEASVRATARRVKDMTDNGTLHALVNCAGVNNLSSIEELSADSFDRHMNVNARAILLTVQALLPMMKQKASYEPGGTVCNIISNASHQPMRMSLAYNASKAAAAMITRQMARELFDTHGLTVFGVSPNRLHGTPMSVDVDKQVAQVRGWTSEEVDVHKFESLPIHEETDPAAVAEFVAWLLTTKERHRYLHGSILDYGS